SAREYQTSLGYLPPSRGWPGMGMRRPWRWSSLRSRFFYMAQPFSCRHDRRFKIWANGLPRDDTSWHAHHRAVAGYIRNHQGICADQNVVTDGHSAHHFTTGAEVNIVAKSRPTDAPDIADANTLIKCTTMANSFRENK